VALAPRPEQVAHDRMTRATVPDMAAYLQDLFGQKLTAAIVGINNPKAIGAYARGQRAPHPEAERRLRDAFHVATLLMTAECSQTVRSWFMGMNPHLDDRAPALVIGEQPNRVMQAAKAYLANG